MPPFSFSSYIKIWDDCIEHWYKNSMTLTGPLAPFGGMPRLMSKLAPEYLPEPYYGNPEQCIAPVININPGSSCPNEDSKNWNYRYNPKSIWSKSSVLGQGQLIFDFEHKHNCKYSDWQKDYSPFVAPSQVPGVDWWKNNRNEYINRIVDLYRAANSCTVVKDLPAANVFGSDSDLTPFALENSSSALTPFALELCPLHSIAAPNFNLKGLIRTYIGNVIEPACESLKYSKNFGIPFGLGFGAKVRDVMCNSGVFSECKRWKDGYEYNVVGGKLNKVGPINGWPVKPGTGEPKNRTYALLKGNFEDPEIGFKDHHPYFLITWYQGYYIKITHQLMLDFKDVDKYIIDQITPMV